MATKHTEEGKKNKHCSAGPIRSALFPWQLLGQTRGSGAEWPLRRSGLRGERGPQSRNIPEFSVNWGEPVASDVSLSLTDLLSPKAVPWTYPPPAPPSPDADPTRLPPTSLRFTPLFIFPLKKRLQNKQTFEGAFSGMWVISVDSKLVWRGWEVSPTHRAAA